MKKCSKYKVFILVIILIELLLYSYGYKWCIVSVTVFIMVFIIWFLFYKHLHYPQNEIDKYLKEQIKKYGLMHITKEKYLESIIKNGLEPKCSKAMLKQERGMVFTYLADEANIKKHIEEICAQPSRRNCNGYVIIKDITDIQIKQMKIRKKATKGILDKVYKLIYPLYNDGAIVYKGILQSQTDYSKYVEKIEKELFRNPNGIHGVTHAKRVLYLALKIACRYSEKSPYRTRSNIDGFTFTTTALSTKVKYEITTYESSTYEITQEELNTLALACCYHDIGRYKDTGEHAGESVKKVENQKLLNKENLSDDNKNLVLKMILNHEKEDNEDEILCNGTEREKLLQKILKDADALDRVRISKYNLKSDKLRLPQSHNLIELSHELLEKIPRKNNEKKQLKKENISKVLKPT